MKPSDDHPRGEPLAEPATVSFYEKHKKKYTRDVKGRLTTWRWAFVWFTQILFYYALRLIWNDRQTVLFHLVERKFYLFGLVLWPQAGRWRHAYRSWLRSIVIDQPCPGKQTMVQSKMFTT